MWYLLFLELPGSLTWRSSHAPGPDFWEDTQSYYLSAAMGDTAQGALTDRSCFVSGPVVVRAKDSLSLHLQDNDLWSPTLNQSSFALRSSAKIWCQLFGKWLLSFWVQLCPGTVCPRCLAALMFCSVSFSWLWMEERVAAWSRLALMGSVVFKWIPVSLPVLWFM